MKYGNEIPVPSHLIIVQSMQRSLRQPNSAPHRSSVDNHSRRHYVACYPRGVALPVGRSLHFRESIVEDQLFNPEQPCGHQLPWPCSAAGNKLIIFLDRCPVAPESVQESLAEQAQRSHLILLVKDGSRCLVRNQLDGPDLLWGPCQCEP